MNECQLQTFEQNKTLEDEKKDLEKRRTVEQEVL